MKPTRREFVITTTTAMCAISLSGGQAIMASARAVRAEPMLFEGDPYTAHVDDHGLGGRTWDSAYEHATRFRSTPADRDRFVLGWEV